MRIHFIIIFIVISISAFIMCDSQISPISPHPQINRSDTLPDDITKQSPANDPHPPIMHSNEYAEPIPLPEAINTSGAEDSPFILPDGKTLYFFFTPDVRISPEKQLFDDVSGVWVSRKFGAEWKPAERIWLQEPDKLALDGGVCIQNKEMWFASAREGFTGVNMFTAALIDGKWSNWQYCGDRLMHEIQIGEVHIHNDDLYFHSNRAGGKGDLDIWITTRDGEDWSEPQNIEAVNSDMMDGFPCISTDGNEFWLTRTLNGTPAIYRSLKIDDIWTTPELMVSQFAGEATLDDAGNLYFVHHYYENNVMIEADIYVAFKL